jgi:D-lactate dehydrogenase
MLTHITTYDRRFSRGVESHVENDWKDISTWGTPKCTGARRFCEAKWNFLSMAKNSQWKNGGKLAGAKHNQDRWAGAHPTNFGSSATIRGMRVAVFSTKPYDCSFLEAANVEHRHEFTYLTPRLMHETVALAAGYPAVCVFVQDQLDAAVVRALAAGGTRLVALRCAGFNNVDLAAAADAGVAVVRVPAYSPYAVAEHTVGLILALNRHLHRAYNRVREGNFSLEGLLGFDMHGRTAGVIGTGQIGFRVANILHGFGCRVLAHDRRENAECLELGVHYVPLDQLYAESDIISLHCPLTPETHHLIDHESVAQMKRGVMLVNTSRGGVVDTLALIEGLKSGQIGYLGLDVYEEEADLFFEDLSNRVLQDDVLARLLTFPNVIITGHQAFFTREALAAIAHVTLRNISDIEAGRECPHLVTADRLIK